MKFKKTLKNLFRKKLPRALMLLVIMSASIAPFSLMAAPTSSSFLSIPIVHAAGGLTCGNLTDNKQLDKYVLTILEEKIVPQGQTKAQEEAANSDSEGVITCYRQTDCKITNEQAPGSDLWKTKSTCEQVKYVDFCKPQYSPDPNDATKNLSTVICQPVQIIYAQSGANILYTYIGLIYRWTAGTAGIVTVLYLVIGGIGVATAQGDSGRLEKAKERVINSIAGLVLLFLSALILYTINPNFFVR